ncbi:major facilitator superfamily [Bisporella sp. PMI_857]|nr:major facilitator superfamily [Bisporella sp. PMI_857]
MVAVALGMGLGGVNVMIDMIVCNLVHLRKRGDFIGLKYTVFTVGSLIGPFVGGVFVDRVTWRWVFYICLPICSVSLILMLLFLHVKYQGYNL